MKYHIPFTLLLVLFTAGLQGAPLDAESASESASAEEVLPELTPRGNVVLLALDLLDTTYRYGGTSPLTGLDCSGLVRYVYEQAAGLTLPRSSREMSRSGEKVEIAALQPGDLLFFARPKQPVSHVGIYIGDYLFIHAATKAKKVQISDLRERYFRQRLVGARRHLAE